MMNLRRFTLMIALTGSGFALAACDPSSVSTGGSVYYDSMMWNDYYYHRPNPPRPGRPPPGAHPGRPVTLPGHINPPSHRPSPRRR